MKKYSDQEIKAFGLMPERIPKHVAVIMDGNGRWAKKRALNRLKGHKAGIILSACRQDWRGRR